MVIELFSFGMNTPPALRQAFGMICLSHATFTSQNDLKNIISKLL